MKFFTSANVATLVNEIVKNMTGDNSTIVSEDLSNLVDVGTVIANNTTIENFRNVATGFFDRIGKIVYSSIKKNEYDTYDLGVDMSEFATMLEKIYINPIDFEQSYHYANSGGSSFADMFNYHNLTFNVSLYDKMGVFRTKPYSIGIDRFKSAFVTESELMKMIGEISNMISTMYMYAIQSTEKRVTNELICSCAVKNNTRVIDLLKVCKDETGVTYTTSNYKTEHFYKFATSYMEKIGKLMAMPTKNFNDGTKIINTLDDDIRKVMITDFKQDVNTFAYAGVYNVEYLPKISDWREVPCWQNSNERFKIKITPSNVYAGVVDNTKTITTIQIDNVVGAIFDRRGAFYAPTKIKTGVQSNDFDEHVNYIHKFNVRECTDISENCVVFVLCDASGTNKAYTLTET